MPEIHSPEDVFAFVSSRQTKLAQRLRTKGIDLPHSDRAAVYRLSDAVLALDAPSLAPDPEIDPKKYTATFTITTPSVDRYGDVVVPKGCIPHLKSYENNPVVFFSHKSTDFPVGLANTPSGALALRFFDDKILSTVKFHEETEEARVVGRLVMLKILKMASIGFKPVKASLIDVKALQKDRPNETEDGEELVYFEGWSPLKFLSWELLEWSVCPIGANRDCLAEALSRGKIDDIPVTDSIRKMLTPYATQKTITAVVGGFVVPPETTTPLANTDPGDETKEILVLPETPVVSTADKECVVETTSDSELLKCIHECVMWLKDNLLALSEQNQVSHSAILAAIDTLKPAKAVTPEVVKVTPASPTTPPVEDYSQVLALLSDMTAGQKALQTKFFELTGREV